jgi:hypothetical protein
MSCSSTTPLGLAIIEHGPSSFTVETLEGDIPEEKLDEREAHWIATLNTIVPNGYNKMRHGRCRHREASSLSAFYAPTTVSVELRQIKRGGSPHLIYAYLHQVSGEEVRVVFGQGAESTYVHAVRDATKFLEDFATVSIVADPRIFDTTASEYSTKLTQFDGLIIQRIRVAKWNSLVAVYIDAKRICFGGKTVPYEAAVEKALSFAKTLHDIHPEAILVNNVSKSATGGCSPS